MLTVEVLTVDIYTKSSVEVATWAPTCTVILPVLAPVGTVTDRLVGPAAVTIANVPLNFTTLFAAVVEKLVPTRFTLVPLGPVAGEKLLRVRAKGELIVKSVVEVATRLSTSTVILPVLLPVGTLTVRLVAVAAVTVAVVPLNFTTLLAAVVEKLVPVRVMVVPTVPEVGENPVRVGVRVAGLAGSSFSLHELTSRKKKRLSINILDTFFMAENIS